MVTLELVEHSVGDLAESLAIVHWYAVVVIVPRVISLCFLRTHSQLET